MKFNVAILTISDRCFNGEAEDKSGPAIQNFLLNCKDFHCQVVDIQCSPDDKHGIQEILLKWCDVLKVDLILTTGGTGLSNRDVTPEAVKEIIEKEVPGLSMKMMLESLKVTKYAALSRPVCGCRALSLIITLPGSSKGAIECLSYVVPVVQHAIDLLRDSKREVNATHIEVQKQVKTEKSPSKIMQVSQMSEDECCIVSKADVSKVARRDRKSPYPLISVNEAQAMVYSYALEVSTSQMGFSDALGYSLAEDVYACEPLPPFPASIKDGYAVIAADGVNERSVIGYSSAGASLYLQRVTSGSCIRINTGAPIPPGADAVVQVEDTEVSEENVDGTEELKIKFLKAPTQGQDIRVAGSDISKGELLLTKGTVIGPAEIGTLASAGVFQVTVYNKPTVAVLSTGNELQNVSTTPLKEGHIYDSNKITLISLLRQFSIPYFDVGIALDDQICLIKAIRKAFSQADILVTSGGVSMGDRDLLRPVLIADFDAKIHFAQVFMKPGKPTTFASCIYKGKKKLVLGLPGNPVSAIVTAHLYLMPLCYKISGRENYQTTIIKVKLASKVHLDSRPEYQRVTLSWSSSDGLPTAHSTGNQISSRLMSCSSAQALLQLPPRSNEISSLPAGSVVEALLLNNS